MCVKLLSWSFNDLYSIDLNNVAILIIFSADYFSSINGISKSEPMNLFKNVELNEKGGT